MRGTAVSTSQARYLRRNLTDAETKLWNKLRNRQLGYKFRRQVPRGSYIVDFMCAERKLIVEVDGGQHYDSEADKVRDTYLRTQGYRVIRFWNHEVLGNIEGVLQELLSELKAAPSPQPSPSRERELKP